jgi:hypothetical protein
MSVLVIAGLALAAAGGGALLLTSDAVRSDTVSVTSARPTPRPSDAQGVASRLARCEADLRVEHARWSKDPSREINPSSCDQPGVSAADYIAAYARVGGKVWTTSP